VFARLTVSESGSEAVDLIVDASPDTPALTVLQALADKSGIQGDFGRILIDGQPANSAGALSDLRLHHGARVTFGAAAEDMSDVESGWFLRVIAGPDLDAEYSLIGDEVMIGRGLDLPTAVSLSDGEVSRRHALLRPNAAGVEVVDLSSLNGTDVDGAAVTQPTNLRTGSTIGVGDTTLRLESRAATSYEDDGRVLLHRPPRVEPAWAAPTVRFPQPPAQTVKRPFPWAGALAPVIVSTLMAVVLGEPQFLFFALLTPVTMGANIYADRRLRGKDARAATERFTTDEAAAEQELAQTLATESAHLRRMLPSPDELVSTVRGLRPRLWERRHSDKDFLVLRVGTADLPTTTKVLDSDGKARPAPQLPAAPVAISLCETRVLGVAGRRTATDPVLAHLLLQVAGWHSDIDARIWVLGDGSDDEFVFARWLPHAWESNARCTRLGLDPSSYASRVRELDEILDQRQQQADSGRLAPSTTGPTHVVVLLAADVQRRDPIVAKLLRFGQDVGLVFLCAASEIALLPEEVTAVIDVSRPRSTFRANGWDNGRDIKIEGLRMDELEPLARRLAPLRIVDAAATTGSMPDLVSLVDLLDLADLDASDLVRRWRECPDGVKRVPVGADANGPVYIDMAEDGPHALVAGATGAGKSEFLLTLLASLAATSPPDALSLLFIDFKGGSTFGRLIDLPHFAGLLTNLDRLSVNRALTSLQAEMTRRQELLSDHGVSDHLSYLRLRQREPELPPLPSLVIVVDEFAEMRSQIPDCVDELVRIARIGRSLGMHLILATQIPRAAITAEIRGNTQLKVSLRMQTVEDSHDVLDSPLAYRLPQRPKGRAYIKSGDGSPRLVQVGLVSQPSRAKGSALTVEHWRWADEPVARKSGSTSVSTATDLDMIVELLNNATDLGGWERAKPLLLDELPPVVDLDLIDAHVGVSPAPGAVIGLQDLPELQMQQPFVLPIFGGSAAVIGSLPAWRTTVLRTAAVSLSRQFSPELLHLHIIDGGRGLQCLRSLPNVGTMVHADDEAGLIALLRYLQATIDNRQSELGERGFGDIDEQWRHARVEERSARVVLLVDQLDLLVPPPTGVPPPHLEMLQRVLVTGPSCGVTVLASGNETLLRGAFLSRFAGRLIMKLNNENDAFNAGVRRAREVAGLTSGRAIWSEDETLIQIAVVGGSPDGSSQADSIAQVGAELAGAFDSPPLQRRPYRRIELPTRLELPEISAPIGEIAIGVGGDESSTLSLALSAMPLLVLGPAGSGRSSALRTVATQLGDHCAKVLVLASKDSPLTAAPIDGSELLSASVLTSTDWDEVLADSSIGLVVDDLDLPHVPDALTTAIANGVVNARLAVSCKPYELVPPPIRVVVLLGSLIFLNPADLSRTAAVGLRLDRTQLVSGTPGRGYLQTRSVTTSVQVAVAP
jgi:S-DNA-T family DNA segregation ATPase FtsK/SpoIIIE